MTFACREMQRLEIAGFFRLEITCHSHKQQTINDLLAFVMGKSCQKT